LQKLWTEYQRRGVQVVGVGVFEKARNPLAVPKEKAQGFKNRHKLTYPVLVDETSAFYRKFGTGALPWNVIIDQKQVVRYSAAGFRPPIMVHTIQTLLGAKGGEKR
jgi:peroxiredoxin